MRTLKTVILFGQQNLTAIAFKDVFRGKCTENNPFETNNDGILKIH